MILKLDCDNGVSRSVPTFLTGQLVGNLGFFTTALVSILIKFLDLPPLPSIILQASKEVFSNVQGFLPFCGTAPSSLIVQVSISFTKLRQPSKTK